MKDTAEQADMSPDDDISVGHSVGWSGLYGLSTLYPSRK